MARAVRYLKTIRDPDTTFLCLSNSNWVYINTILEVHPELYSNFALIYRMTL